jgi:hypothetical protein
LKTIRTAIVSAFVRQLVTCFGLLAFQVKHAAKHAIIARQRLAVRPLSKARANELYISQQCTYISYFNCHSKNIIVSIISFARVLIQTDNTTFYR